MNDRVDIFAEFQAQLLAAVASLQAEGILPPHIDLSKLEVAPPLDAAHGHVTTNAALVLATAAGTSPKALAALLAKKLAGHPDVASLHIAGPGFINAHMKPVVWSRVLQSVIAQGKDYGRSTVGGNQRVCVQYVSADHSYLGQYRCKVLAETLAAVLKAAGFDASSKGEGEGPCGAVELYNCERVALLRDEKYPAIGEREGEGEYPITGVEVGHEGSEVLRFMMLFCRTDQPLQLDPIRLAAQNKDNPAFNIQYAHARICQLLRKAESQGISPDGFAAFDLHPLTDELQTRLTLKIATFPHQLRACATAREPSKLTFYLNDLADDFRVMWSAGKEAPQLHSTSEGNDGLTKTRLAFLAAIRYCLANGLGILGLRPVGDM